MKFVTLAMEAFVVEPVSPAPVALPLTGVTVGGTSEVQIGESWTRFLGTTYADRWNHAHAYIHATDADLHEQLAPMRERVAAVYHAMWLHSVQRVEDVAGVNGDVIDGKHEVHGTIEYEMPTWLRRSGIQPRLDATTLESVDRVAHGLLQRNRRSNEFLRLWHGLKALLRGLRYTMDPDPMERASNLIRSLEVLVFKPGVQAGAKQFAERAVCFAAVPDAGTLEAAYQKLRNAAVHMHSRQYVHNATELERVEALAHFVDLMAVHVWREILGDPVRLEMMSDARLPEFQKHLMDQARLADPAERTFPAWTGARFSMPSDKF